jgi:1-phosphofructokinase
MIVTITLNPSVDRTIAVDRLQRGAVNRATAARVDPGGKGINVSRALAAHGVKTRAVVALGGAEGRQLADLLAASGVEVVAIAVAGAIRSNIAVIEPDGTTTKLNEPGATLTEDELGHVLDAVTAAAAGADWVVASGSVPPGVPDGVYAEFARRVSTPATRVGVDTSGPPLAAALRGRPALVKPNVDELAEFTGHRPAVLAEVVLGCRRMRQAGAGAVLASLGADGAVLVEAGGTFHARAAVAAPLSSVGAGDALLAGFLAAGGSGPAALAEGVAWGAAAVALPGSRMPGPGDVHREGVWLTDSPDLALPIS